ncbi:MAG: sorbosone dehydrogenase family protein [Candidatus Limnocylindria bacterium]
MHVRLAKLAVPALIAACALVLGGQSRSHAATCVSSVGPGEAPPPGLTYGYEGFHAAWYGQSGYPTLCPGARSTATVAFLNTGTRGWVGGRMGEAAYLGTWNPTPGQDRPSILGGDGQQGSPNTGWPRYDRPAAQPASYVGPGQVAWFQFTIQAPMTPGFYRLHLRALIEGAQWLEDYGIYWPVTVLNGDGSPPTGVAPRLAATVIQGGLRNAWDVAFLPDGRMLASERVGNLLLYASAAPGAPQLTNTAIAGIHAFGEAGLMSVTPDPQFSGNGLIYLCASRDDEGEWRNQVLRYRMTGDVPLFDGYVIRRGMLANGNHDGCRIRFGPDGKLWVTMGDRGDTSLPQDPNALNGKVLRMNGDGSIPADNPIMPGAATRTAVYTMGNRNPQGLTFEPATGRPFEVEHGDTTEDEINILVAGANYGYPIVRGPDGAGGYADPAWSSGAVTLATSGGDFVVGDNWGSWSGSLFVATLKESDLRRFTISGGTATLAQVLLDGVYGRLRTPRLGPDGALFLTTDNGTNDKVIRISATQP